MKSGQYEEVTSEMLPIELVGLFRTPCCEKVSGTAGFESSEKLTEGLRSDL
jgi:hypothetical protein